VGWLIAGVALVHKGHLHRLAGYLLDLFRQLRDLGPVLFIGGGDIQRQQMAQGIHREVGLAAFAPFRPIVAGLLTAFRGGLQGAPVKNDGTRLFSTALRQPQYRPQVMHQRLKHPRFQPALRNLAEEQREGSDTPQPQEGAG